MSIPILDYNEKKKKFILKTDFAYHKDCKAIPGGIWDKQNKVTVYPELAVYSIKKKFYNNLKISPSAKKAIENLNQRINHVNRLKEKKIQPREHDFLMYHQRVCRDIASLFDSYAFFLDTGTGKTITSLQIIEDNPQIKWVIICPKSIIKTAWLSDNEKFYPHLKLLPLSKNMNKQDYISIAERWGLKFSYYITIESLVDLLITHAQGFIINPESFKKKIDFFLKQKVNGLIFDESVKLKDPSTDITKTTIEFAHNMDKVYLLSGQPAPNNPMEFFSQMRIVDPSIFGNSFYRFRQYFFAPTDYMGYNWKLKKDKEKLFYKQISLKSIFISKEDCLDLPEKTYLVRSIELTGKAWEYYSMMAKARLLDIDDTTILAPNILTNIMKLRQITSGFIIDEGKDIKPIHNQKLKELISVLEEIGDKQVIIWTNFKNEIHTIEQTLKSMNKTVVTAYSGTKDTDASVAAFKSGEAQYIIAHPQTLKYGVTFTNCTYAVYYSLSYSFDDYYQSHDRIYRKGQTKPCTFIFLLCKNTIDEVIYAVLQEKKDISEAVKLYAKGVKNLK